MTIRSVHCAVLGAHVTEVVDLEGAVTQVICAEYDHANRRCRVKHSARDAGPLGQLLERVSENALDSYGAGCLLMTSPREA